MLEHTLLLLGSLGAMLAGCSEAATPAGTADAAPAATPQDICTGLPTECVIQPNAFDGFHSWPNAPAMAPPGMESNDGIHMSGPLQVYWNQAPSHGLTTFPTGTVIVKETQESDVTQRTTFAMVKRDGTFNVGPDVAVGWEWWSVRDNADGTVIKLWSGTAPAVVETYSMTPAGDCNGCHSMASDNDFVWDTALTLSKF